MTRYSTLNQSATVVLDGSGGGTARIGPLTAMETWYPDTASVRVDTNVKESRCSIYVGETATPPNFKDQTFTGSSGDASGKVTGKLPKGMYVWAVWTGGDVGSTAYLNVSGDIDV